MAEGRREAMILEARGKKESQELVAEGEAKAIELVNIVLGVKDLLKQGEKKYGKEMYHK